MSDYQTRKPFSPEQSGDNNHERSFTQRHATALKAFIISILTLLLLIPSTMIMSLISERQERQREAVNEVSSKWGNQQMLIGPIISIPFYTSEKNEKGELLQVTKYAHFLPDELNITGNMLPEKRHRGIYDVILYNTKLKMQGSFSELNLNKFNVPATQIQWNGAVVTLGISDLRGINDKLVLNMNGKQALFNPGLETNDVVASGVHCRLPISLTELQAGENKDQKINFSFDMSLRGSELLYFVPVGKETNVKIESAWKNPSFAGAFLPTTPATINQGGFEANWKVLHLNRNFPQSWVGLQYQTDSPNAPPMQENKYGEAAVVASNASSSSLNQAAFGVNLLLPIDGYAKSTRAAKYAVLFIGLSFLIFYFLELLNNISIHPFQYLLIGLGLVIFYTLLISISEHLNFNNAYLIASIMTIGLITWYAQSILKQQRLALLVGSTLLLLYLFIFVIIQLQDYALLVGSLGLFLILATVMSYSRKIDWYGKKLAN